MSHPEESADECGGAHPRNSSFRCSRPPRHDGQHGYAGMSWDHTDEELAAEDDSDVDAFAGLHGLIADAVSFGIQQAVQTLIERLAKSYATS